MVHRPNNPDQPVVDVLQRQTVQKLTLEQFFHMAKWQHWQRRALLLAGAHLSTLLSAGIVKRTNRSLGCSILQSESIQSKHWNQKSKINQSWNKLILFV